MKRTMMTRFSAGCLALLLTFGSVCSVQAAQEPAEPNTGQETQTGQSAEQTVQTGSVTVQLTPGKEGTSVADVEFFLTKVGEIQDSTYTLLPEYDNTEIDLNTLITAEQLEEAAKTLAETAKQEQGKKTDGNGQVVFEKQELGVYLLTTKDQPGYDLVSPTLLSIPTMETDETLVLLGVGCFYLAYREQKPFQEIKVKGEALQKLVVQETGSQEADPMERTIDFAALQRINPEIVGWLYVPQIGVDSPILTGQTDTEYLTKDFEGAYSPLGSIFTFAGARLSDSQVYLFAHNMASGQMFGSLKQFTDEAFLTANPEAYLYTPERVRKLKVEGWTYLQADDPCFSSRESQAQDTARVTLVTCVGYFQTPKRLAVNTKVVETRTAF